MSVVEEFSGIDADDKLHMRKRLARNVFHTFPTLKLKQPIIPAFFMTSLIQTAVQKNGSMHCYTFAAFKR